MCTESQLQGHEEQIQNLIMDSWQRLERIPVKTVTKNVKTIIVSPNELTPTVESIPNLTL